MLSTAVLTAMAMCSCVNVRVIALIEFANTVYLQFQYQILIVPFTLCAEYCRYQRQRHMNTLLFP
jgi:hypothetical protein